MLAKRFKWEYRPSSSDFCKHQETLSSLSKNPTSKTSSDLFSVVVTWKQHETSYLAPGEALLRPLWYLPKLGDSNGFKTFGFLCMLPLALQREQRAMCWSLSPHTRKTFEQKKNGCRQEINQLKHWAKERHVAGGNCVLQKYY